MVTTDVAQLSAECNGWRDSLRSFRDEFGQLRNRLQKVAGHQRQREVLQEVEHLANQFHIQLINIHDLKQVIKNHSRKIDSEMAIQKGQVADETLAIHENLYDQYQTLNHTLQDLRQEFDSFIDRTS